MIGIFHQTDGKQFLQICEEEQVNQCSFYFLLLFSFILALCQRNQCREVFQLNE